MSGAHARVDPDVADEVVAFLRSNPSFLTDHPDLYRILTPPVRVHGDTVTDHMAAMIRAGRVHAAQMSAQADVVVNSGRAAAGLAERVQEAVIALMRSDDPIEWVEVELPGLLGLDAAALCVEHYLPGTRRLPAGQVRRLLNGRDVVFRDRPSDAVLLHAEAAPLARHDALIRVPGENALLALAARHAVTLHSGQGSSALAFLGRAVSAALGMG